MERAWALAGKSGEIDHLLISAAALAEKMWIESRPDAKLLPQFLTLVERGIRFEYPWPAASLALWLWMLGDLRETPDGLPQPYLDLFDGGIDSTVEFWESRGIPYERALALMCGDVSQCLQALHMLDSLGASAVASKVRQELRADGVSLPRGRGKATRSNRAGLTGRQAEVLRLLDEGLSNA